MPSLPVIGAVAAWLLAYIVGVAGFLRDRWQGPASQTGMFLTILGAAAVTAAVVRLPLSAGTTLIVFQTLLVSGGILTLWGSMKGLGRSEPPSGPPAPSVRPATDRSLELEGLPVPEILERIDDHCGYGEAEVTFSSHGRDVVVISDLHLGSGQARDGGVIGTENFFADPAFDRFMQHLEHGGVPRNAGPYTLIINGDFVDFIRVIEVPQDDDDFQQWSQLLEPLGIYHAPEELRRAVSSGEVKHGLRTTDYKCVWKLAVAMAGHSMVFKALAESVKAGNRLVIVKGNHDVEWYWPAVRHYLRLRLAEWAGGDLHTRLGEMGPRIQFVDHAMVIDRTLYIEHGHRFEAITAVLGDPVLPDGGELTLPFGSFLNRYVVNHVELGYPFIDNIRPQANIIPVLFRERFPTALRLLFQHIPLMVKTIPRRYFRYFFFRILPFILALGIPAFIAARSFGDQIGDVVSFFQNLGNSNQPGVAGMVLGFLGDTTRDLAWLVLGYIGTQVLAAFQLRGGQGQEPHARRILAERPELKGVVLGHTHDPQQTERHGQWFYNAGTWIPVLETSSASVRHDRTFTFLHVPAAGGAVGAGRMYRWHDESGRAEPHTIVHRS